MRPFLQSWSRALRRSLALLSALTVLLVWSTAWAIPAGMCDEHAQSAAAPLPLFPSNNGEASSGSPCGGRGNHELGRAPTPDNERNTVAPPNIERLLPLTEFALPRDRGQQLPPAEATRLVAQPGFGNDVFRPPRS